LLFVNWRRSADVCLACAKWRENGGAMRCLTWRHASACGSKAWQLAGSWDTCFRVF
jgi:hypothetical protein